MNKWTEAGMVGLGAFAITMGLGSVAIARADGYDPNLIVNAAVICKTVSDSTTDKPIDDMFAVFGRNYTISAVYAVCPRNAFKAVDALTRYRPVEDSAIDWNCLTDGNKRCGRD